MGKSIFFCKKLQQHHKHQSAEETLTQQASLPLMTSHDLSLFLTASCQLEPLALLIGYDLVHPLMNQLTHGSA